MPYDLGVLLATLALLLFVQPDAPVRAVGEFSDMGYTDEHAYGHAVQLWRADGEMFGLFLAANGLAGDTPTGRLERLRFDRATGRLRFDARLPIHGLFVFDGTLSDRELIGELIQRSTPVRKSHVRLLLLEDKPPDFANFERWNEWVREILAFRGAKPYPIDRYLAPGLVLEEAMIPEGWVSPKPMPASDAVRAGVEALQSRGVREVRICRLNWIVAPLGAAIVLATGRWQSDGVTFSSFAIGIHDGTEVKYGDPAGKEFSFLARGVDSKRREAYFDGERVRLFSTMTDPMDELLFEFVSREALAALPKNCR